MESLILQWGLLALFAGVALEGDVTMLLGGGLAHRGLHSLAAVLATGTVAAVTSDTICFLAGRHGSRFFRSRFPATRRAGAGEGERPGGIARLVERVGPAQLLFVRFLWGTRVPSLLLLGSGGVPIPRFLFFSVAGSLIWTTLIGGAGYLFSSTAAALLGEARRVELWLAGAIVAGAAIAFALHRLERRGAERAKRILALERAERSGDKT